jgi:hypothetical protein
MLWIEFNGDRQLSRESIDSLGYLRLQEAPCEGSRKVNEGCKTKDRKRNRLVRVARRRAC